MCRYIHIDEDASAKEGSVRGTMRVPLQGYLAHKKHPPP